MYLICISLTQIHMQHFFSFFFASAYIVTHSNILNNIYSLPSDTPKLVVPSHTLQSSARQAKAGSSHSHTTIIRHTKLAVPTHTLHSSGIQSWQFPLIHYTKLAVSTHTLQSSGKQSWQFPLSSGKQSWQFPLS